MAEKRDELTYLGVPLEPDAWARLMRAVRVIGRAPPIHKTKKKPNQRPARKAAKRARNSSSVS